MARRRTGCWIRVRGRAASSAEPFPAVFRLTSLLPVTGGDGSTGFVLRGVDEYDTAGSSVSGAGDVNGDGLDDLIIGASRAGQDGAGASYIVFGASGGFPPIFPLASLMPAGGGDGTRGFVLTGSPGDYSGRAVSSAGDVNGDGIDDLIIGASHGRLRAAGECFVVFGRTDGFPARFLLEDLLARNGGDGSEGFVIKGTDLYSYAGEAVSGAGDVNGDGIDDVIIGAPGQYPFWGIAASYIVFGRNTGAVGDFPPELPLSELWPDSGGDGSSGFVLAGYGSYILRFGWSVSGGADINGDDIDDVIIGVPDHYDWNGRAYVVFGRDVAQFGNFPALFELADLLPAGGGDGSKGFVLDGVGRLNRAGDSVSIGGDFNADGIDDIIVGADLASPHGDIWTGESYVVFGRDSAKLGSFPAYFRLATLHLTDGRPGFALPGIAAYDSSGGAVSAAGDLNGDGVNDLVIAAREAGPRSDYAGEHYVVFGRDTAHAGNFPATFPLVSLLPPLGDGTDGFAIYGMHPYDALPNNQAGRTVSGAGDVNGDGLDDLIIGATWADPRGRSKAGEAYVVYGRAAQPAQSDPNDGERPLEWARPGNQR